MFKIRIKLNSNIILVFACIILAISTILIGSFLYLEISYASKFFPRTKIADIDLSGKTKEEARELLTSRVQEWNEQTLKVQGDNKSWEVANKELGVDFSLEETIEKVFQNGRTGNLYGQFSERLKFLFWGQEEPLISSKNEFLKVSQKISTDADTNALNTGLKIDSGKVFKTDEKAGKKVDLLSLKYLISEYAFYLSSSVIILPEDIIYPNSNYQELEKIQNEAEELLQTELTLKVKNKNFKAQSKDIQNWIDISGQKEKGGEKLETNYSLKIYLAELLKKFGIVQFLNEKLSITLKNEKVGEFLKGIASEVDQLPKNATLGISNEKVVILESDKSGEILDQSSAIDIILNSLRKKQVIVNLPMKVLEAQVRADNIAELGIIELIGRGQSDASGSSSSRKTNIKVGSSKINGVLVAPGEEFSLNKYLVPVDETNGFLPELVIKPGKLVKEYGGGLCQVATTTFRAALYAGLPITERKNHAFAVHYYDWPFPGPGVDATIYPPHPDLRFKNDTGKYILIQTSISGNRLTYDFYGTKGDRRAEVENPQYVSHNPDGSSQTIFYRNVYKGDKLVKRDSFTSYYKPASEFPKVEN